MQRQTSHGLRPQRGPQTRGRVRAAAMIETVLVLPIIMLVLSLLFLFGLNFMRLTGGDRSEPLRRLALGRARPGSARRLGFQPRFFP